MVTPVHEYDQVVYLLQGGGALGAYQVGVCEVLLKHNFNPNWVVGNSIGAINASLIAGSKPKDRIANLKGFWDAITLPLPETKITEHHYLFREWQNYYSTALTVFFGLNNFFTPQPFNPWFLIGSTPDKISFYDTTILRKTLENFIDFDLINQQEVRLTLGAVSVEEGEQVEFDNTKQKISPKHIMASCALPPGFPAIEIDGKYYWDGGVISNTLFNIILREPVAQKLLCFMMNLFTHSGELPTSMIEVIKRKKDLGLASRHHEILNYLCHLHQYQHFIYNLNQEIKGKPSNDVLSATIKKMEALGRPSACSIIRFHYHDTPGESLWKDAEFSLQSKNEHMRRGFEEATSVMKQSEWLKLIPDDAGVVIHDFKYGEPI